MKLRVSHLTRYSYDRTVGFSPHTLYLRPRESAELRLIDYRIAVQPNAQITHVRDAEDNNLARAHIWDQAHTLVVESCFTVETLARNPFDFFLDPGAIAFPFNYSPADTAALSSSLAPPSAATCSGLSAWLADALPAPLAETTPLLGALASAVFNRFAYSRREEEGIQSPLETLRLGSGTCRDFAVFMCELLRMLGMATRFVSGYLYAPPEDDHRSRGAMHAWMEVYLPGAGWKAIDPTHGVFCDDCFIPVAHSVDPLRITPIHGAIAADSAATAVMHTDLLIEKLPDHFHAQSQHAQ